MTRIAVFTSSPSVTGTLESAFRRVDGFRLLPACDSVLRLTEQLNRGEADLALLELTPGITYALLCELRRKVPELKIILWTNSISTELALRAMELGVRGILRKTLPADLQIRCLRIVAAGGLWFEQAPATRLAGTSHALLTSREARLIALLAQGFRNSEIAEALAISEVTLGSVLSCLFQRLGVKGRFELALFGLKNLDALRSPWMEPHEPEAEQLPLPLVLTP